MFLFISFSLLNFLERVTEQFSSPPSSFTVLNVFVTHHNYSSCFTDSCNLTIIHFYSSRWLDLGWQISRSSLVWCCWKRECSVVLWFIIISFLSNRRGTKLLLHVFFFSKTNLNRGNFSLIWIEQQNYYCNRIFHVNIHYPSVWRLVLNN